MVRILLHRKVSSLRMKGLSVAVNILASEGRQDFMPPWQCSLQTSRGISLLELTSRAQEGMHALSTDQQRAAVAPGHRVWESDACF